MRGMDEVVGRHTTLVGGLCLLTSPALALGCFRNTVLSGIADIGVLIGAGITRVGSLYRVDSLIRSGGILCCSIVDVFLRILVGVTHGFLLHDKFSEKRTFDRARTVVFLNYVLNRAEHLLL